MNEREEPRSPIEGRRPDTADRARTARELPTDQTLSDRDQTSSDSDQSVSDEDQDGAALDEMSAINDQRASDRDQVAADDEREADTHRTTSEVRAYTAARDERALGTRDRIEAQANRSTGAAGRDRTSEDRDRAADDRRRVADTRDASRVNDGDSNDQDWVSSQSKMVLLRELERLRTEGAADRARAAADRAQAAQDRAKAAAGRARLEAELRSAHLDDLTGAYRRDMGRLMLTHEIERARRSDGQFVLAFVDVDRLKRVNDREGHAAGDRVLKSVVDAIRARLRPFDPIIRYGGDEFVCGLGGTDVVEAERRFESISVVVERDARVAISVGLASLADGDTPEALTQRADRAMLTVKAMHHAMD